MDESIGAKLKQARELRRLTLQQVSDSTKVRPHYLQALENDDLSSISSVAQARGFLRIYAEFLGLSPTDLVPISPPPDPVIQNQTSIPNIYNSSSGSSKDIPLDNSERRGVLANIFDRFRRPEPQESIQSQVNETFKSVEDSKTLPQRQFAPARVKEVLPEMPAREVSPQSTAIKAEGITESPIKETPGKPKSSRKSSTKPRKSAIQEVEKNEVKKKADE